VIEHRALLDSANVERLIADYDVIVLGTDIFDTRYVLNDAAVRLRKPIVHGSIYRWDGQVTTFVPFAGPCYRCMYPTQPPDELAPACSVAGVLGVLPGIVGMLQANEVFKLLLGVGEPLVGRLLMFDAMSTTFDEVRVWRDPACPACGEGAAEASAGNPVTATAADDAVGVPARSG
jgi:molybdopterin/thiamine biosynthesis adenylyltransferase